jgi:NADPH2:quinone reductase
MQAIVFDRIGSPQDVLELRELRVPVVGPGQALVKMVSASINPGDFLFIQNLYPEPKKPSFPEQIAGNHGAGIVAEVGAGVTIDPGTFVAFSYFNTWAEYAVVPSEWLITLPADYEVEKAAQFCNVLSAWDMVRDSGVDRGQWLVLTGGNSSVATMALQFAKERGVDVISIVRNAKQDLDLRALGATEVIELAEAPDGVEARIMDITAGKGVNAVIDCIGGTLIRQLINTVALGGQVTIYGGMSADGFELHNFDVLLKYFTIKPYGYRYFFDPPGNGDAVELQRIAEVSGRSDFRVPLGGVHALADFKHAIDETIERPQGGKRFFRMADLG